MYYTRIADQAHHDQLGLNDLHHIFADLRDPDAGNASHHYIVTADSSLWPARLSDEDVAAAIDNAPADEMPYLVVQFQHGPRHEEGSTPGVLDAALIAILLDRFDGFQSGPYRTRENAIVITKLEEALLWMQKRARDRARRGVLGTNQK